MDHFAELKNLPVKHEFFIGYDSDGCVFDTMEVKQKECFCPALVKHFNLQAASKYAREVWEFVNLYSKTRGCNRFQAIKYALDFMKERHEFKERGIKLASTKDLEAWMKEETKLGNPTLEKKVAAGKSEELTHLLGWSKEVNQVIEKIVHDVPPFPGVEKVLKAAKSRADMIVVSQTPVEALSREWKENKIDHYLEFIAGQEHGTKAEHLQYAAKDKYPSEKILMIGDAIGDLKAANASNTLFYPIIPGREEESWAKLADEALERFFSLKYAGDYQKALIEEFDKALPATPPWKK
ncbi:MAG: haloacid dehalogenase [Lentisphaerae bacterium GWF2_44_16]|nr:MAG: haloacid dehalogenase [Lentisphaerae bacterium GWF2_44_16]